MEYRRLGNSGIRVPVLSFGTATFGGRDGYEVAGSTDLSAARRLVSQCLEAGVSMFDTANAYSGGLAEEILGRAIGDRRDDLLISTKVAMPLGSGPNSGGSSRLHLVRAVEDCLRRLGTDWIDLLYMHLHDGTTPVEEVVRSLDMLVESGKVRYVGASNFSAWALMKSLAVADRYGWNRYVAHQVQYSLAVRHYEYELGPLGWDQGVGAVAWSPLAGAALTGKLRPGVEVPADSRLGKVAESGVPASQERIFRIVEALDEVSAETGRSLSQIAINWILQQPTVSSVVIGARTEAQLGDNLGAVGWSLSREQLERLDAASRPWLPYPYCHQQETPDYLPSYG